MTKQGLPGSCAGRAGTSFSTGLWKLRACSDALISGYRRHRPLADEAVERLPLFMAARGSTYLGWVHSRQAEPAARELTPVIVDLGLKAAQEYLGR